MRRSYALVEFLSKMEGSDSKTLPKPPSALILINRPDDGIRTLRLEAEDLRLLKQVLNWTGYLTALVDIDDDVDRIHDAVVLYKPTIIVNLVEQMFSEVRGAAAVAGMLDLFGYVYTGSEPGVLLDCQDWSRTKVLLEHAGLPIGLDGGETRRLHACMLGNDVGNDVGNDELECLPICESKQVHGELAVEADVEDWELCEKIEDLSNRLWRVLGLRDVAQIDFAITAAGRVGIVGVTASVDLFGPVFRTAAASREGGMPGAIVRLCHLCHARLPSEELALFPVP